MEDVEDLPGKSKNALYDNIQLFLPLKLTVARIHPTS
jgi:hypothetical protein